MFEVLLSIILFLLIFYFFLGKIVNIIAVIVDSLLEPIGCGCGCLVFFILLIVISFGYVLAILS